MRGADITQASIFSYRTLEERIPKKHPLRKLRLEVDGLLASMNEELDAIYARTGRSSIPPTHWGVGFFYSGKPLFALNKWCAKP